MWIFFLSRNSNHFTIHVRLFDVCCVHRYFSTIAYSADGETLLAAGKSKHVCIYRIAGGILLKKLEITQNHSLDGLDVSVAAIGKIYSVQLLMEKIN